MDLVITVPWVLRCKGVRFLTQSPGSGTSGPPWLAGNSAGPFFSSPLCRDSWSFARQLGSIPYFDSGGHGALRNFAGCFAPRETNTLALFSTLSRLFCAHAFFPCPFVSRVYAIQHLYFRLLNSPWQLEKTVFVPAFRFVLPDRYSVPRSHVFMWEFFPFFFCLPNAARCRTLANFAMKYQGGFWFVLETCYTEKFRQDGGLIWRFNMAACSTEIFSVE